MLNQFRIWLHGENGTALALIALGGLLGSTVSVLKLTGNPDPLVTLTTMQVIGAISGGPFAAIAGVVLLLNVDRRDWLRCFASALVLGYFSVPVIAKLEEWMQKILAGAQT